MISTNLTIPDTNNVSATILSHPSTGTWTIRQYQPTAAGPPSSSLPAGMSSTSPPPPQPPTQSVSNLVGGGNGTTVLLPPMLMEQTPPPPSSSPMLSEQSSPSSSRANSPNRISSACDNTLQTQIHQTSCVGQPSTIPQMRNISSQRIGGPVLTTSIKPIHRPSVDTTPPPSQQCQQQHNTPLLSNEYILPSNVKHVTEVC